MKTAEQVLEMVAGKIDRPMLESFIARKWIRPVAAHEDWHFEEIDVARLQLICHLIQDIEVNDNGMDVVLSLLDQVYGLRAHLQRVSQALARQPSDVRADIILFMKKN